MCDINNGVHTASSASEVKCHANLHLHADDNSIHGKNEKESEQEKAAVSHDEILFMQPESTHLGECPICFLPLPIDPCKSSLYSCCSTLLCKGCSRANKRREVEKKLPHKCPFCRKRVPRSEKEVNVNNMKRVAANDAVAIQEEGKTHYQQENFKDAFDCWTKAAELGNVDALYLLSLLFRDGRGVEKNEKMETFVLEKAAIAGHVGARFALAHHENSRRGRLERAVKHLIIASSLGCENSMKALKRFYADGKVDKGAFSVALRAHQDALNAMKSPHREEQDRYERAVERLKYRSKPERLPQHEY